MGPTKSEPKPLALSCTKTDCEASLHCFRHATRKRKWQNGPCIKCGADLVDWPRVTRRDLADVDHTFGELSKEWIRHHFWHEPFDQKALEHARRKGRVQLREAALNRITRSVGPAEPTFDGRQTPYTGNVLYYAQHSVAACCRKCIEYWHGIQYARPLTNDEIAYLSDLVMRYIDSRLPDLADEPEMLPLRPHE